MKNPNQTILVIGATGNQGGAIARNLLQRKNFIVRALVRDLNNPAAQILKQAGAELFQGDLNNSASIELAMQGVYGVFSVQGLKDGLQTEIAQGKAVADAAKKVGIQQFIYSSVGSSSVGSADRKTGIPHFESKFQIEEHIRSLDLPYTILGPVFFFFNYSRMRPTIENGALTMPLKPETKLQQLCEDDYGRIVAEIFEQPKAYLKRRFDVASVEMTMTEIADTFSRVLGKNVKYQQISFEDFEQKAGKETTAMYRWLENTGYKADLAELKREFQELTSLESYLRKHGWAKPAVSTAA